jgi:hypothetical protein
MDPSKKAIAICQVLKQPTTDFTVSLLMEESYLEYLDLIGDQHLTEVEIVEICKTKPYKFSLEASCTMELGMDEYLNVRKQIGRLKMFTCKNLKIEGSEEILKLIEFMLNKPHLI